MIRHGPGKTLPTNDFLSLQMDKCWISETTVPHSVEKKTPNICHF